MSFLERPKDLVFLEQHEGRLTGKERMTPEIAKDRFNVDLIFEYDDDTEEDLLVLKSRTKYGKTESEVLLEIMECM